MLAECSTCKLTSQLIPERPCKDALTNASLHGTSFTQRWAYTSKQEIFQVVNGLDKIIEREFGRLMRDADTNKDGFPNFEEFKALIKKDGWGKNDSTDNTYALC